MGGGFMEVEVKKGYLALEEMLELKEMVPISDWKHSNFQTPRNEFMAGEFSWNYEGNVEGQKDLTVYLHASPGLESKYVGFAIAVVYNKNLIGCIGGITAEPKIKPLQEFYEKMENVRKGLKVARNLIG